MIQIRGDASRSAWLGVFLALSFGCGEGQPVAPPETTRVVGLVTDAGQSVSGGWIEFIPSEGTVGSMRSAPIGPDGRFEADRVPVGSVAVGFAAVRTRRTDPRVFDSLRTDIRRVVPSGVRTSVSVDLTEELIRSQAETAARGG